MGISDIKLSPCQSACDPTIQVKVTIEYQQIYNIFGGLWGQGFAGDGRRVGPLELVPTDEFRFEEPIQPEGVGYSGNISRSITFNLRLTQAALDHIEKIRQANRRRDVVLKFDFTTLLIQPKYRITPVGAFKLDQIHQSQVLGQYDPAHPDRSILIYELPELTIARSSTMNFISPFLPTGQLGQVSWIVQRGIEGTIPSSEWTSDYAPAFGLGNFLVVEMPEIQPTLADGDLAKRLSEAAAALPKMRKDILEGEWTNCAEHSRPVVELLNQRDLMRKLLTDTGLSDDTANALIYGLSGVFDYASKFHHRVDRDGKVAPAQKADKEDAYLAYFNAVTLVNLVAEKHRRLLNTRNQTLTTLYSAGATSPP